MVLAEGKGKETIMLIEIYTPGSGAPVRDNLLKEDWIKEVGNGHLSGNGMRQQYNLGAEMRKTYETFFNQITPEQAKVFSSGRSRSLISAISHNHGLFSGDSRWGENDVPHYDIMKSMAKNQPRWNGGNSIDLKGRFKTEFFKEPVAIPLESEEQYDDFLFIPRLDKTCPLARKARDEFRDSYIQSDFTKMDEITVDLEEDLQKIGLKTHFSENATNPILKNLSEIYRLYDAVRASRYQTGSLPSKMKDKDYNMLELGASGYFMLKFEMNPIRRLYTHHISELILNEIIRRTRAVKLQDFTGEEIMDKGLAYLGFSGEDDTVAAMLHMFKQTSAGCLLYGELYSSLIKDIKYDADGGNPSRCYRIPPFSSSLVFEVVHDKDMRDFKVILRYNFENLTLEEASSSIPLDQFVNYMETHAFSDDFEAVCGDRHANYEYIKHASFGTICLLLIIGICIFRAKKLQYDRLAKKRQEKSK